MEIWYLQYKATSFLPLSLLIFLLSFSSHDTMTPDLEEELDNQMYDADVVEYGLLT